MSRSQILATLVVIGIASIPSLATTASGLVQMQRNSLSGERERKRERIASSVLSFPEFADPKWPKKLTFRGLCVDRTSSDFRAVPTCDRSRLTFDALDRIPPQFPPRLSSRRVGVPRARSRRGNAGTARRAGGRRAGRRQLDVVVGEDVRPSGCRASACSPSTRPSGR